MPPQKKITWLFIVCHHINNNSHNEFSQNYLSIASEHQFWISFFFFFFFRWNFFLSFYLKFWFRVSVFSFSSFYEFDFFLRLVKKKFLHLAMVFFLSWWLVGWLVRIFSSFHSIKIHTFPLGDKVSDVIASNECLITATRKEYNASKWNSQKDLHKSQHQIYRQHAAVCVFVCVVGYFENLAGKCRQFKVVFIIKNWLKMHTILI